MSILFSKFNLWIWIWSKFIRLTVAGCLLAYTIASSRNQKVDKQGQLSQPSLWCPIHLQEAGRDPEIAFRVSPSFSWDLILLDQQPLVFPRLSGTQDKGILIAFLWLWMTKAKDRRNSLSAAYNVRERVHDHHDGERGSRTTGMALDSN